MPKAQNRVKKPAAPKSLSPAAVLGQQGVNLIESVVLKMGSRWNPAGPNETGIDGYIELYDPATGQATGLHVSVQSKAVTALEVRGGRIVFDCERKDVEYWLRVQPPLILIVSCPSTNEAYWLAPRDQLASGTSLTARFDREQDAFSESVYASLAAVAQRLSGPGPSTPVLTSHREVLFSNLVPLASTPHTVWIGRCRYGSRADVRAAVREVAPDAYPAAFIVRDRDIISFEPLSSSAPLASVVEPGTAESLDAAAWAKGMTSPDDRRAYVELLNRSLTDDLGSIGVRYVRDDKVYAFRGRLGEDPRRFSFRNIRRKTTVTVVNHYLRRSKDGREFPCLRHTAMRGQFRELGGAWYLEIEPTYVFTADGNQKHRFHEDLLAGIKRFERNRAVVSQVMLWGAVLAPERELFETRVRHLGFGPVAELRVDRSIPDKAWGTDEGESDAEEVPDLDLPLLQLLEELEQ
jgi:hypothetical protein